MINTQHKKYRSRLFSLLFFTVILLFTACKKNIQEQDPKVVEETKPLRNHQDSLTITIDFKQRSIVGLNVPNDYFHSYSLVFNNTENEPKKISKKIIKNSSNQVISFLGWITDETGASKVIRHYYLVNETINQLDFTFDDGNIILKKDSQISVDDLFNDYNDLSNNIYTLENSQKEILADSLFNVYKARNNNNKLFLKLNQYHYLNVLQQINPTDKRVKEFLEKIENPIDGQPLGNIIFFYVKNNMDTFNFEELNTANYTSEYIELLSKGIFNFLRHEDQKGDKKYQPAIDWLKTTAMCQNDSIYIKKEITPLNNAEFKNKLSKLKPLDTELNETTFVKILKKNPSKYYLIDFWATWCKPCIEGVEKMHEMKFPKSVKVISLSIDKADDQEKWLQTTRKIRQKYSYLLQENTIENKEFLTFIYLESVPRYILIDHNMNLIDEAFLHPQEPLFLDNLRSIKH